MLAALTMVSHQPRLPQYLQVLRDCWQAHAERFCQLRHRKVLDREPVQHLPACRVGYRTENITGWIRFGHVLT